MLIAKRFLIFILVFFLASPPTVMLLSRPGCELMDTLLRDLAYILKSNGIQITFSLLEQSELDAEGGISSYLQRNIDTCDYILIMFTDDKLTTSMYIVYRIKSH